MYALINWTETHPITGSVIRRSLAVIQTATAERVANALRECGIDPVEVEYLDLNDGT